MRRPELLVWQRNQVLQTIEQRGLNPNDFTWSSAPSEHQEDDLGQRAPVPVLVYTRDRRYFYQFDEGARGMTSVFSPGRETQVGREHSGRWDQQVLSFRFWLEYLRRETESPDLWKELGKIQAVARLEATSEDSGEAQLSDEERKLLTAALSEVQKQVEEQPDLVSAEKESMLAVLKRIEASGSRIGRKDILMVLIGAVAQPLLAGALTPENGRWLLFQLVMAFSQVKLFAEATFRLLSQ